MFFFSNVTRTFTIISIENVRISIIRIMDVMVTLRGWSVMMRAEDGKLQQWRRKRGGGGGQEGQLSPHFYTSDTTVYHNTSQFYFY